MTLFWCDPIQRWMVFDGCCYWVSDPAPASGGMIAGLYVAIGFCTCLAQRILPPIGIQNMELTWSWIGYPNMRRRPTTRGF